MVQPVWRIPLFMLYFFSSVLLTTWVGAVILPQQQFLDQISALPGQPPVKFLHFSGYITVNQQHGRALFYWLVEAEAAPLEKPLVLWLNGGPGCSSVGFGASGEIGPFRIHKNGSSLYLNKYSWNKEANLLFLESPAGVGFSYTNTTSDLFNSGDKRTALENLIFMERWMARFPQYKHRDLYIVGESYAGHYIPQLAKLIVDYNKVHSRSFMNFKGIMVGNGVTDSYYDSIGTVTYWWTHSLVSDTTYHKIMKSCDFRRRMVSQECNDALIHAVDVEMGNIDQYSIYSPTCPSPPHAATNRPSTAPFWRYGNTLLRGRPQGYDPCTQNHAEKYYNLRQVQKAMHANTTGIPYRWTACSNVLNNNWMWNQTQLSMLPTYRKLIATGVKIWIFSGDMDSNVPTTASRFSFGHLNLPIKTQWYPWYFRGQVGGWTEVYDGLTFAIVRGAGHEVPILQPGPAFVLLQSFLAGKDLPRS